MARSERTDGGVRMTLQLGEGARSRDGAIRGGTARDIDGFELEKAGVAVNERGLIVVDENYQTAAAGMYAAGDVIGFPALASTSMEQGRLAVCHAFGFQYKQKLRR